MKCKFCEEKMTLVYCDDNGGGDSIKSIAYNIYDCEDCMCTLREDVWEHPKLVWIKDDEVIIDKGEVNETA